MKILKFWRFWSLSFSPMDQRGERKEEERRERKFWDVFFSFVGCFCLFFFLYFCFFSFSLCGSVWLVRSIISFFTENLIYLWWERKRKKCESKLKSVWWVRERKREEEMGGREMWWVFDLREYCVMIELNLGVYTMFKDKG